MKEDLENSQSMREHKPSTEINLHRILQDTLNDVENLNVSLCSTLTSN